MDGNLCYYLASKLGYRTCWPQSGNFYYLSQLVPETLVQFFTSAIGEYKGCIDRWIDR